MVQIKHATRQRRGLAEAFLSRKFVIRACAAILALYASAICNANDLNLPDLGGLNAGGISPAQEYHLGQQWLRRFRAQAKISSDPFIQSFTENLITRLANYSDLSDKRLDIMVVENPTLNAFAVPGGVVGVHTGLFRHAETEQQFASVMAHELAHLSQRHFARQLDEQRNNRIPNLAALFASILVLANSNSDAGIAAISAARAAAIENQLRFSRRMEQEADRLGMETMVRAGMNPYAMPNMFDQMLDASRFQSRPPEFLITHPLPESRVSDSKLRAQQYPKRQEKFSMDYQLVRVRARLSEINNYRYSAKAFASELKSGTSNASVSRYGLGLAYLNMRRFADADAEFDKLVSTSPNNIFFALAKAEAEAALKKHESAIARLDKILKSTPDNHPANIKLVEILMEKGDYKRAESQLLLHSRRRPKDEYVWYLLAETHGLAGNIFEVHTARSEYFLLNGIYQKSENHIRHALKMIKADDRRRVALNEKLKHIQRLQRDRVL